MKGKTQQLDVVFGPNYRSVVIYSPNPRTRAAAAVVRSAARRRRRRRQRPVPAVALTGAKATVADRGFIASNRWSGSPIR